MTIDDISVTKKHTPKWDILISACPYAFEQMAAYLILED